MNKDKNGLDLADFLIKEPYATKPLVEVVPPQPPPIETSITTPPPPPDITNEIAEIEAYFKSIQLPSNPIRLSQGTIINDVQSFIESHLSIIKRYVGNETFLPYLNRLQQLQTQISIQK